MDFFAKRHYCRNTVTKDAVTTWTNVNSTLLFTCYVTYSSATY